MARYFNHQPLRHLINLLLKHNETLSAISFFTAENNVDFTAKIYDNFDGGKLQDELAYMTGTIEFSGLHTIVIPPLEIETGDDFYCIC